MDPSQLPEKVWYFAYGSNIRPERLRERIATLSAQYFGDKIAILPDYKVMFHKTNWSHPDAGYANIVPAPGSHICGVVYCMSPEGIAALDHFEKTPTHYTRQEVTARTFDPSKHDNLGEPISAQAYFAVSDVCRDGLKPTREYMNHLCSRKGEMPDYYQSQLEAVDAHDYPFIGNNLTNDHKPIIPTLQK